MPTLNNELNLNDWREIMIAKDTASDAKAKSAKKVNKALYEKKEVPRSL